MNFDKWIKPTIHEVVVGKQAIGVHMAIPRELIENHIDNVLRFGTLEERQDYIMGHLIYEFSSYLLKSTHNETAWIGVDTPATWWDHLKHDFAKSPKAWQRWTASKLSAPQYRTESKKIETVVRLCPHNDSYLSEKPEEHFHWLTWEGEKHE